MTGRPRRNHSPAFKAKVALATMRGEKTLAIMTKPLSQNLRVRVVNAVEGGMSRRAAAAIADRYAAGH